MFSYCNSCPIAFSDDGGCIPFQNNLVSDTGTYERSVDSGNSNGSPINSYKDGTKPFHKHGTGPDGDNYTYQYTVSTVDNLPYGCTPISVPLFDPGFSQFTWHISVSSDSKLTIYGQEYRLQNEKATAYLSYTTGLVIKITVYDIHRNMYCHQLSDQLDFVGGFSDEFSGIMDSSGNCGGIINGAGGLPYFMIMK